MTCVDQILFFFYYKFVKWSNSAHFLTFPKKILVFCALVQKFFSGCCSTVNYNYQKLVIGTYIHFVF